MKKIKIDDTVYLMPEGWNEITLDKFQKVISIPKLFEKAEGKDYYNYNIDVLSTLLDCDKNIIRRILLPEMTKLIECLSFLQKGINDININESMIFNINNKMYGFDILMEKITYGQFIDLDIFLKNGEESDNGFWFNVDKIMALLIRPAKKLNFFQKLILGIRFRRKGIKIKKVKNIIKHRIEKYDYDTLEERALLFKKHMTMDIVNSISVFFCNLKEKLQSVIQDSSQQTLKEKEAQMKLMPKDRLHQEKDIKKDGVGIK